MSQTDATLHVAVFLNVENIVEKYPNPEGDMIDLQNESTTLYEILPINNKGYIEVPTTTKQITFTLSDKDGQSDGRFWLTRFVNEDKGPIAGSTPNAGGTSIPANVLTVDVKPNVKKGDTEDFKLHCYFIYFDQKSGENWVYHCKTDPVLQAGQTGGGG